MQERPTHLLEGCHRLCIQVNHHLDGVGLWGLCEHHLRMQRSAVLKTATGQCGGAAPGRYHSISYDVKGEGKVAPRVMQISEQVS